MIGNINKTRETDAVRLSRHDSHSQKSGRHVYTTHGPTIAFRSRWWIVLLVILRATAATDTNYVG